MGKTGTKRLRFKKDDYEIELEREEEVVKGGASAAIGAIEAAQRISEAHEAMVEKGKSLDIPASLRPPLEHAGQANKIDNGIFVKSPMVGTFYSSAGPDEPLFIKVGDKIDKDTVVCIIEAMKVMNEVKAGEEGIVTEVLVENGHPVEFGTKLFKIS